METLAANVTIPERVSSLNEGKKAIKRKRANHKSSQKSLNALLDLEYWDHELAIRETDLEEVELSYAFKVKEGVTAHRSPDDLNEAANDLARKKARIGKQIVETSNQRGRLEGMLEAAETSIAKDLRKTRHAYAMVITKLALKDFTAGPRNETDQSTFRELLIREHKARSPENPEKLWCPVLGEYVDAMYVTAAHIFPYNMGEDIMTQVFGEECANEMFSPRNGLLLASPVERVFDKFRLVIVPVGTQTPGLWKIRIVDKSILKQQIFDFPGYIGPTFDSLDHKELQFKGTTRPAARYLYFHYAIAVMKASSKYSTEGWLDEMGKNCWATPGAYLRAQMLEALLETVGHLAPECPAIEELQQHTICDEGISVLKDKLAASLLSADIAGDIEALCEEAIDEGSPLQEDEDDSDSH